MLNKVDLRWALVGLTLWAVTLVSVIGLTAYKLSSFNSDLRIATEKVVNWEYHQK